MLSYVSVDLLTGRVIADLPDLVMGGAMKATMMRAESVAATLPLDTAPVGWRAATRPYSAAVICLDDDGERPLWGGIVDGRETSHTEGVAISLITIEGYLARRFVGDLTATSAQNQLVKTLIETFAVPSGLPFRVQIDGGNGATRTRTYVDSEDKSVLSALEDLAGIIGGPEWTGEWERAGELIKPVIRVSDRLGPPSPAGLSPAAWFTLPGSATDARLIESMKAGEGANDLLAVSSGADEARPQSSHHTGPADGRPKLEHRFTPSTSITETDTLDDHAERALGAVRRGSVALMITANRAEAHRLGSEWRIGDDVGFDLVSRAWPAGLTGTARVIGTELTEDTVTPILLLDPAILDTIQDGIPDPSVGAPPDNGEFTLAGVTDNGDGTWTFTSPGAHESAGVFNITV